MNNKIKLFTLPLALALVWGIITIKWREQAHAFDHSEYIAIENTLRLYLQLEREAIYSLDDTRLSEVLANDPRGGLVGKEEGNHERVLQAVRYFKGNPDLKGEDLGFLDYKQADYAFRRLVRQFYAQSVASGAVITPEPSDPYINPIPQNVPMDPTIRASKENADRMQVTVDLRRIPEIQNLMDQTGFRNALLPPPRPEKIPLVRYTILEMSVNKDLARVIVDLIDTTLEYTFVKIDGKWYIAGEKAIKYHGG